ncbi:xanthine phosphoribosyltransferase [Desulfuromonas sp. AOP6]|uniref:xanthine phosphoribosyltransferase n=1 Tax=Desulfuromonas sp. AOP6 TaxID=1566351 RepID=UPI0012732EA6|nr:xanthine phosphoribosyltransferase [Desulfuromonas sp. AOP6]BCA80346.1 xanthine phosphoribosyltransferase [Desulfuromonas sp. AOP6]
MQQLIERLRRDARSLAGNLIKVDSFLNHQVDTALLTQAGQHLAHQFAAEEISKIVTAEASGIIPAFATAQAMGIPFIYARKSRPLTMADNPLCAEVTSRTRGSDAELFLSREYLGPTDRILVVDDFLGSGQTAAALGQMVRQSGATLCAFAFLVEKGYEKGRVTLANFDLPVKTLARIDLTKDGLAIS